MLSTATGISCFFKLSPNEVCAEPPVKFNNPFQVNPDDWCLLAAAKLQQYLISNDGFGHDFGLDNLDAPGGKGKMFGVLLVRNINNELGFLAAFSGNLGGRNSIAGFVPPIVDLLDENGFYRIEEDCISEINRQIDALEKNAVYLLLCKQHHEVEAQATHELELFRQGMKAAKQKRDILRQQRGRELSDNEVECLKKESLDWQYGYKRLAKQWRLKRLALADDLKIYTEQIDRLKMLRKTRSAALQKQMFSCYRFLNGKGEYKGVVEIFEQTKQGVPPAAAGDCAAPKLLQYAFANGYKPLAIAEFWWGQAPQSEVRKHGRFYPACRSKCEPILGHMLNGVLSGFSSMVLPGSHSQTPSVVYEDDGILVLNKPADFLSVPGKSDSSSVYQFVLDNYPGVSGPLIVHRLDMSTSGLMVVAKNLESYHHLQNQFLLHTVEKRYEALLDGVVDGDSGLIELPLRVDLDNRPRQLVCFDYGKPAVTRWQVIERMSNRTRIAFYPLTGRTHQLRLHSAHPLGLNIPIVGDDLYGVKADRLCLHAQSLSFLHPVSNHRLHFKADAEF
jgi:tRNA pseudouridine32 synthase / 23S rRNA pseudouridine746 synthase